MSVCKRFFILAVAVSCAVAFSATAGEKEALVKFYDRISGVHAEYGDPVLETMECDFTSEIRFSEPMLKQLQPLIMGVFNKELPRVFKNEGVVKAGFKQDGKPGVENVYIYTLSDLGSFSFSKVGDKIEMMIPHLASIVRDDINEIKDMLPNEMGDRILGEGQASQLEILRNFFDFVIASRETVMEESRFLRNGTRKAYKTHIYQYDTDEGVMQIEIFDNLWTLASVRFQGDDGGNLDMYYALPSGDIRPASYYPESLHVRGTREGNTVAVSLSNIRYNKPLAVRDFRFQTMNLRVFMTSLYIKALQ